MTKKPGEKSGVASIGNHTSPDQSAQTKSAAPTKGVKRERKAAPAEPAAPIAVKPKTSRHTAKVLPKQKKADHGDK